MTEPAPTPFFFTLLAYRPDCVDTCRGQVMDRSSSEFSVTTAGTADEIAREWAKLTIREEQGREYGETEYTLLLNGRTPDAERELSPDDAWTYENMRDEVEQLVKTHLATLRAEQARALEEATRLANEQRREAEEKRKAAQEAAERAELLRLQAKFGSKA